MSKDFPGRQCATSPGQSNDRAAQPFWERPIRVPREYVPPAKRLQWAARLCKRPAEAKAGDRCALANCCSTNLRHLWPSDDSSLRDTGIQLMSPIKSAELIYLTQSAPSPREQPNPQSCMQITFSRGCKNNIIHTMNDAQLGMLLP